MKRERSAEGTPSSAAPRQRKRKVIRWDTLAHDDKDKGSTTPPSADPPVHVKAEEASSEAPHEQSRADPSRPNAQRETLSAAQATAPSTASSHLAEVVQLSIFDALATARVVEGAEPRWNTCYRPSGPQRQSTSASAQ